jgi:hypothetical protein
LVYRRCASVYQGAKLASPKSAIPKRGRPFFAVPVIGTGYGGKYREAYTVIEALLPALATLADECDVALVTYSEAHYSAALEVQRKLLTHRNYSYAQQASEIANLAGEDKLVLFFGAGVSVPSGLPDWSQLLDQLAAEAGIPTETNAGQKDNSDNDFSSLNSLIKHRFCQPNLVAITQINKTVFSARRLQITSYDIPISRCCMHSWQIWISRIKLRPLR